jgi:hypothetical protein
MKYIKLFENFDFPPNMNIDDIEEIFLSVSDLGFIFHDVHLCDIASMGDKDIIGDHNELDMNNPQRAVSIRLVMDREPHKNTEFHLSDDFYEEFKLTIDHFESRYDCELSNIYIRKNKPVWVKDIDSMRKYIKSLTSISWISSFDLAFTLNDTIDN